MEILTYTNPKGETVTFGDSPIFLQTVVGLGDLGASIQTQKSPFQDGSTRIDAMFEDRNIAIQFMIVKNNYQEVIEARQHLGRVLNPKLGTGVLRYESENVVREIDVSPDSVPIFPDGQGNRTNCIQKGFINLVAFDPYWRSTEIVEAPMFVPLFQFPFEGVFEMGLQQDQRNIYYDGDAPTPLQIEFYGPASNPKIINNTTGEFIKVKQDLLEGERMIIDTADGNKSVYFVDEEGNERNVFNWIDLNSTFFKLQIGDNEIEYTADSNIQGSVVNISYSKLYTAI